MKQISSGVLLWKKDGDDIKFFVCTPDGPYWKNKVLYNFPKGHVEENEDAFETAIREFKEETGKNLSSDREKYTYEGIVKQKNNKEVHVFSKEYENEDLEGCYSNTCTTVIKGQEIVHPEVRGYCWMTLEELSEKGMKCYLPLFESLKNKNVENKTLQ